MKATLHINHASIRSDAILNFAKIAHCLGISSEFINLGLSPHPAETLKEQLSSPTDAFVWDLASLGKIMSLAEWRTIASKLAASSAKVLILVTKEDEHLHKIIKILSKNNVLGLRVTKRSDLVTFAARNTLLSKELSGHRYPRFATDALAMDTGRNLDQETVMELGENLPAFVSIPLGTSHLFIWSSFSVFDPDRPLAQELEFERTPDEYIPAIIFLRNAFGERCWHNPNLGANVMIDDPLLEKQYGFIFFPELLRLTRDHGAHVTVAFIPWNYRRTQKQNIHDFLDHSFSICAHGCDHIKNEFRRNDYKDLLNRSYLAAERMDLHRERTGMEWDRVMVCPRERYSIEALQAIADSGKFLGLVNTGCLPRELGSKCVRGSDLLLPAQDAFFGLPIFKRHYWSNISVFAMSAFLGKPTILVEHHDFFQDKYYALKDFYTQLNSTCPHIRWSNLTNLVSQTYLQKHVASDTFDVRFFTDEFQMSNPDPGPRTIRFHRRFPQTVPIESVTLNGTKIPFTREEEFIRFESRLDGKQVATLRVQRSIDQARTTVSKGWTYNASVAARRLSSELRDNWLSRNKTMLGLANRFAQMTRSRVSMFLMLTVALGIECQFGKQLMRSLFQ